MKIAIPVVNEMLSMHFGHCEKFAVLDVDISSKTIISVASFDAPPHEPGLLPRWLAEKNVNLIIAGGMGQRAQTLFNQNGIEVIVGAPAEKPETIVAAYMAGTLETGINGCDH